MVSVEIKLNASASRNLSKVTFETSGVPKLPTDMEIIMSIDAGSAKGTACD